MERSAPRVNIEAANGFGIGVHPAKRTEFDGRRRKRAVQYNLTTGAVNKHFDFPQGRSWVHGRYWTSIPGRQKKAAPTTGSGISIRIVPKNLSSGLLTICCLHNLPVVSGLRLTWFSEAF